MNEATDVSALISRSERDRVAAWVKEAEEEGASIATGGTLDDHGVLRPTVTTWATGDRSVVCSVHDEQLTPLVASVRSTGR